MEIYVLINNQPNGPYTQDLIRQYLASGQLQPTDLAAVAGSADWKPLSVMMKSWGPAAGSPSKIVSKGTSFGSTPPAAGAPKKSSKGKTAPLVIGIVVLVLAGGAGFAYWKFFGNSGPVVKVVTPAEPGFPNTLAELNAWYVEPPAGQNAATFFQQGFDAMQITEADRNSTDLPVMGKGALPTLGSPLPTRTKAALAGLMQRNKTALDAFQQGVKYEQSRYPLELDKGFEMVLPHLTKIKNAAQLEGLAAALFADNRAPDAAAAAVRTSLAIGQSLKDEPALISQLVRVACLALARGNLERVVNSVALRPVDLDQLAAAVDKAETLESAGTPFTRALAGERASTLGFFDMPPDKRDAFAKQMVEGNSGQGGAAQSIGIEKLMRKAKSERAFAEETLNRVIVMRKQSFPERLKADEYLTARAVEAKSNDLLLCTMTLPALGKQTHKEAAGLAQLRLMQTAIALERYRAANNNRYPAGLAELSPKFIPAVPQDPFTGDSFGYKKTATGYELSSAGSEPGKGSSFIVVKPPPAVAASAPAAN